LGWAWAIDLFAPKAIASKTLNRQDAKSAKKNSLFLTNLGVLGVLAVNFLP
jgi:hypothetical protein